MQQTILFTHPITFTLLWVHNTLAPHHTLSMHSSLHVQLTTSCHQCIKYTNTHMKGNNSYISVISMKIFTHTTHTKIHAHIHNTTMTPTHTTNTHTPNIAHHIPFHHYCLHSCSHSCKCSAWKHISHCCTEMLKSYMHLGFNELREDVVTRNHRHTLPPYHIQTHHSHLHSGSVGRTHSSC